MRDVIEYEQTNSIIEPQASDSEKLDGLNTHLAVFDEICEYKNYDLINIIKNSTDTREQPLLLYITTAGYH
nr:terminase large subunit [Paenibacillus larvae]